MGDAEFDVRDLAECFLITAGLLLSVDGLLSAADDPWAVGYALAFRIAGLLMIAALTRRMDEHPLMRFADGPAGRRARLVGSGLDVWEVLETVHDNDGDLAATAAYLEIALGLVQAAVAYYGA